MKKIFLANIGNRNITFEGETFSGLFTGKKSIFFRDWSKDLLEKYEKNKDKLDINIINPLVLDKERPDKIILFYSDQEMFNTRTDQDTVYEAEIMKKILIEKYQYNEIQISLERVKSEVTNNGNLIKYYRNVLKNLIRKNKDAYFTICDAGGTAQQKMSLKLMAEFLLQKDKYEVKYTQGNELVNDVNIDEYRKIISQEQAITLIHIGEYTAAAKLLDYFGMELFHNGKDQIKKNFAFVFFKFIGNEKLKLANYNSLKFKPDIFLENNLNSDSGLTNYLGDKKSDIIINHFNKAIFYLNLKKYSNSILSFAQFYEILFTTYVEKLFAKREYGNTIKQDKNQKIRFEKDVKRRYRTSFEICKERKDDFKISIGNLATQCVIMKNSKVETMKKIAMLLSPYIEYTDDSINSIGSHINNVRNKIAHNGKYIVESDINSNLSYYPRLVYDLKKVLNLKYDNLFSELNNHLELILRQQ